MHSGGEVGQAVPVEKGLCGIIDILTISDALIFTREFAPVNKSCGIGSLPMECLVLVHRDAKDQLKIKKMCSFQILLLS